MLVLSQSFLRAMSRLPPAKLRRIPKFVQMLDANRTAPSLNVERLAGSDLRSARLDRDYRGILGAHPQGVALLYVDKHDDAYRWADRHASASAGVDTYAYDPWTDTAAGGLEAERPGEHAETRCGNTAPEERPRVSPLTVGSIHSWSELEARFRWDTDKHGYYLRERNGGIVCACLRADMNPNAPWEILVGKKPENIRQAKLLAQESRPVPVFVKEAVDQWEYWGDFLFDHYETEANEILPRLPESRRDDTALIVFLRDAGADAAVASE